MSQEPTSQTDAAAKMEDAGILHTAVSLQEIKDRLAFEETPENPGEVTCLVTEYFEDDYGDEDYTTRTLRVYVSQEQIDAGAQVYMTQNEQLVVLTQADRDSSAYYQMDEVLLNVNEPQLVAVDVNGQPVSYDAETGELKPIGFLMQDAGWETNDGGLFVPEGVGNGNPAILFQKLQEREDLKTDPRSFFSAVADGMDRQPDLSPTYQGYLFLLSNALAPKVELDKSKEGMRQSPVAYDAAIKSIGDGFSNMSADYVQRAPRLPSLISESVFGKDIYQTARALYGSVTDVPFEDVACVMSPETDDFDGGGADLRDVFREIKQKGEEKPIPSTTADMVKRIYRVAPNETDRVRMEIVDYNQMTFMLVVDQAGPKIYSFPKDAMLVDEQTFEEEKAFISNQRDHTDQGMGFF